jgi:aminoglycoside phosphotransferase (APT) family kinase protein
MQPSDVVRAVGAAIEVASGLGLAVDDASVVENSNKLALRLLPCDVFARVAFAGLERFESELEIARRLAEAGAPVAGLVEPRVHEQGGFAVTLWTYYEPSGRAVSPAAYANALERLHAAMARVDVTVPHFSERVAEALDLVASPGLSPQLEASDRELLGRTLRSQADAIGKSSTAEQLLHGEPHEGNLLDTETGPVFIDLETCCRGPVEFDLAHVPEGVAALYAGADRELLRACRLLVLAMVAAWRWDRDDQFPDGERAGQALLDALRAGPPWPALDVVMRRPEGPVVP